MKKIETIWHYLLYQAIEIKQFQHTQAGLATLFHFSTSTINLALTKPTAIGAIRKSGKFFVVTNPLKLFYLAATFRNLPHDIIYHTTSTLPMRELEGLAPPEVHYGAYSAARLILGESPADYNALYLYADPITFPSIKARYPDTNSGHNKIYILRAPSFLPLPHYTSLPHTFVDIWNLSDWYAHDFTLALEAKVHDLLS